jgi:outer membrane protein assembly factor BamA
MPTILICIIFSLTLAILPTGAVSQEQFNPDTPFECSQPTKVQNAIIREAERDQYTTRRVEFIGNRDTRDAVLRRRIIIGLQEGDLFTRWNLIRSLRNVSKLKLIHPVKVSDVELHLNRSERTVDMIICFKEKERRKRAS